MEITVKLQSRPDGGLRVSSDTVPGLILSGPDPVKVCASIWPVFTALQAAAEKVTGYCRQGDRCVCGGDTPAIQACCGNWVKR